MFKPERYLEPNADLQHFLQYSEFGSSSCSCLGQRTAIIMLKSVIVEIFRRHRVHATPVSTSISLDTADSYFNRIANCPKLVLHPRG